MTQQPQFFTTFTTRPDDIAHTTSQVLRDFPDGGVLNLRFELPSCSSLVTPTRAEIISETLLRRKDLGASSGATQDDRVITVLGSAPTSDAGAIYDYVYQLVGLVIAYEGRYRPSWRVT